MWLENDKKSEESGRGEWWDLVPKSEADEFYGSLFVELNAFSGASRDVQSAQVGKDFVVSK